MTKSELENIYAETFSGVTLYYRDTTLDGDLIAKYHIGQILRHNGIVDMTYKNGGLNGNIRYMIASAKAKDVSNVNPMAAHFGHFVLADETLALTGGVFFVVLDVYNIDGKTQVTMLHIKKEFSNLFSNATTNLEEAITALARADFNREAKGTVLPELEGSDWTERTKAPVGMDFQGNFFHQGESEKAIAPQPQKPWQKLWQKILQWKIFKQKTKN